MHRSKSLSDNVKSPTLHALTLFSVVVFAAILVLSFVLKVEIVARGIGRVVPEGKVQEVQTEYAGSVTTINVIEGSLVSEGDILIELDQTEALRDLNNINAEHTRLEIESARLLALQDFLDKQDLAGTTVQVTIAAFEKSAIPQDSEIGKDQTVLLRAELTELLDTNEQYAARAASVTSAIEVTNAEIQRSKNMIEIQRERLDAANKLLESGNSSRASFLNVLQTSNELDDSLKIALASLAQQTSELRTIEAEKRAVLSSRTSNVRRRQSEITARKSELLLARNVSERRAENMAIRAPADGIVDKLELFTDGAIVSGGDRLLSIVPSNSKPMVEVVFSNVDVGFLEVGQKANIKLDAFPSERFGLVEGKLQHVSADAVEISSGQWGFAAQITPNERYLSAGADKHPLKPGMTATVDVITGERNLISYFFAPILRTIGDSMGER